MPATPPISRNKCHDFAAIKSSMRGPYFDALQDAHEAVTLVAKTTWRRLLTAWVLVPAGILVILLACRGVDSLISLGSVSFPASVALLIVLFLALIGCQAALGDRKTKSVVRVIDVPAGFALRYINVFFTPSFVLLPLSPPVSGIEVVKIIGVFLIGYVVVLAVTAYLVRGLQLLLGTSKRTMTERAEEMGRENDEIPLTQQGRTEPMVSESASSRTLAEEIQYDSVGITAPLRAQDPAIVRGTGGQPEVGPNDISFPTTILRQDAVPLTRAQDWAAGINARLDTITYGTIFVLIGIPIYYSTGYAMPIQLSTNVLAYTAALALPPRYKPFLHPVLVSSGITILAIWVLALSHRSSLKDGLEEYSTKTRYLQLWNADKDLRKPGAGDVFSSVLDVSIVALSLPMFQYRNELKRHFLSIFVPNITIAIASLFGYPTLCYLIGITPKRSLSFAARSLTLALANPVTSNLKGDINLVAVLCIMSGILGVLLGPTILKWLKIPEDDYVTRGVSLGGNSSAIATALLIVSDPRAAALSSLSMSLFGTVMVALTSIPPVVRIVQGLAGI